MIPTIKDVNKQGPEKWDLFSWEFAAERKIRLTGEITDQMADEAAAGIEYLDRVGKRPITVVINSPGGSVSAGFAILDAMDAAESEIITVCTGMAASMGAFLAACGGAKGKRFITKNAEMMIHQPLGGAYGQSSDVQVTANHLAKTKKKMVQMIAAAAGKSEETVEADIDRDYWLDAKEAVEYGLADAVL